jgi:hypothetical protein
MIIIVQHVNKTCYRILLLKVLFIKLKQQNNIVRVQTRLIRN